MHGIILAGGMGSRLWPLTKSINKHFLPVFDKPMIYYPLSTQMLMGIRELTIVSNPIHIDLFKDLFGNGSNYGLDINYVTQNNPGGLPEGISLASKFIGEENFSLILGDNIFYGVGLGQSLNVQQDFIGARIFCYQVANPQAFGVAEIEENEILSIEEKPAFPKSNLAITGLYFFENEAKHLVSSLKPSSRGELEIVDLLNIYLRDKKLSYEIFPRGTAWLDTGTPESLLEASEFVHVIEKRQGAKVACIEEISWRNGWISDKELANLANSSFNPEYKKYLLNLIG
jgi:glucose-1-phosphate thymidylyltransferase